MKKQRRLKIYKILFQRLKCSSLCSFWYAETKVKKNDDCEDNNIFWLAHVHPVRSLQAAIKARYFTKVANGYKTKVVDYKYAAYVMNYLENVDGEL